jgi:putative radical SAM enzyme (TIGR03279 family)
MKGKEHRICKIVPGSIAEEMDLEPGDKIISINDQEIEDVFDYHYLINDTFITLVVEKKDGEEWELEIEKEYEEDLGIEFDSGLMDEYRSCRNSCIFCFIDQMPKGMRDTLYFKDDDSRLSFLQGNYVTLTNMSDQDLDRVIKYKLSPINISVQATNPELRCRMLHNRFAGNILERIKKLYDAGITMNGQIVLCKGINDGEELNRSIEELSEFIPHMQSVSVVPVGLTKFRENLYPLEPFSKEEAREVLELIHSWQRKLYREKGTHFIHGGDEWYILAGEPLPVSKTYDGYLQLENGVGMTRLLLDEFKEAYRSLKGSEEQQEISIATGVLAFNYIEQMVNDLNKKYPNYKIHVYKILNEYFGEYITVAGLITGKDLKKQLKGKRLGERLLLPCNMLRSGETVFLDDVTVEELENTLQVPIDIVQSNGQDFVDAIIKKRH